MSGIFAIGTILLTFMLYVLVSGRISLRGWVAVTRDEDPEMYWTMFALLIMAVLAGLALILYLRYR